MSRQAKGPSVLVITNIPAPYRLRLFEAIHKRFPSFCVAFQSSGEPGRYWDMRPSLPYPSEFLRGITLRVAGRRVRLNTGLKSLLRRINPEVVVAAGFSPSIARVAELCRADRRCLILMNDGTTDTDPVAGPEFWYRRWLTARAGGFLAGSGRSRTYFKMLGAGEGTIHTIQLTTDLRAIAEHCESSRARDRARERWGVGSRVVVFVGSLIARKNPLAAVEVYERAAQSVEDLWMLIAGEGDLRDAIEHRIRAHKLTRVRLLGHVPQEDIQDVYAASDLSILLSVHEPYGMVVIEGMAGGVPAVLSTMVGAADIVEHRISGYVVRPDDLSDATNAIVEYFTHDELRSQMALKAKATAMSHDVRIEADHFVDAINRCWHSTHPGRSASCGPAPISDYDLVILTRVLAPYRLPLIRKIAEAGIRCGVVVAGRTLYQSELTNGTLPDAVPVVHRPTGVGWRTDVLSACLQMKPAMLLVEHGARLDFTWTALLARTLANTRRVLWTHGIENRELFSRRPGVGTPGRWLQLFLCDGILCYDTETAARLRLRFPSKVVGAAPNSTDGEDLLRVFRTYQTEGKSGLRRRLGLIFPTYLLGLGRLAAGKELDRLIPILSLVRERLPDTGLIVIGDGPERRRIESAVTKSGMKVGRDVVFAGEVRDRRELALWMQCADIHVNPGYAGLSVVDALFAGLPTVLARPSDRGPFHSPEWTYLRRCEGGLFARDQSDRSFANRILSYLTLPEHERSRISTACADFADTQLGIDVMVRGIEQMMAMLLDRGGRAVATA